MLVNANFDERILVHSDKLAWQDSPIKGVQRRMLDRIGGEVARATSIVKYEPNSQFSAHVHSGGEEFIVLDGVFQDEHGDYPVGSYVRNPPQSAHTPGSQHGCTIFVKLWQFNLQDRTEVVKNLFTELENTPSVNGVARCTLFEDDREKVSIASWSPGSTVSINTAAGAELLVLDGDFMESNESLSKHSWLRLPVGAEFNAFVGQKGAKVWIKTGHLRFVQEEHDRLPA